MKVNLIIFCAMFVCLEACNSGLFGWGTKVKKGELSVSENDHSFSVPTIELSPKESFSFKVSNNLKKEAFEFVLLDKGEDPILVQHLAMQTGELPKSYYLYKSEKIEPGESLKVVFDSPERPGKYYYVALSESPKDSLFGTLIVREENAPVKGESDVITED
jgi:hypothetical protein